MCLTFLRRKASKGYKVCRISKVSKACKASKPCQA